MNDERLRIREIFYSLQGEARDSGRPTVFIRLTGCPLRCRWCDTAYAFAGGDLLSVTAILAEVARHGTPWVCVTGGEPLAQPAVHTLLQALCAADYRVSLETSGALSIHAVDARVSRVMDLKAPDSGECERNLLDNITDLRRHDQVKFVIASQRDFAWSVAMTREHDLCRRVDDVLFSPVHGELDARQLAEWILASRLPVRMQMQLHKLLWNDEPGH